MLANPTFLRLWLAGGVANAMRWLEVLVAGLFVFERTESALLVAVVATMRALPMLLAGALAGAVAEALDRKRLLLAGFALNAAAAAVVTSLALTGRLDPWHLALASLATGVVWAGEMAVRRRMAAEAAGDGDGDLARAVALDSMTGSITRMIGPLLGGLAFESLGVGGAFLATAIGHMTALLVALPVEHAQAHRRLALATLAPAIAEAARLAWATPVVRTVLLVTVVMNVCGFSYTAIVPAWGERVFQASPAAIGLLAAAEPMGALAGALLIAAFGGRVAPSRLFVGGSVAFLGLMLVAGNAGGLAFAVVALAIAGAGTAAFAAMQTALVIAHAPPAARSRTLGLVTTCIGMGPVGVLSIGALSDGIGPAAAITAMTGIGLALVLSVALARRWSRASMKDTS